MSYTIKLSNGNLLIELPPLEGNGLGNTSTSLQIADVEFGSPAFGLPIASRPDAFVVAGDVRQQYVQGRVFTVTGDTGYGGTYTVNLPGFSPQDQVAQFSGGRTYIPVDEISIGAFPVASVTTGASGSFTVTGIENAITVFLPSRTLTVVDNDFSPANTTYTVASVQSSSAYTVQSLDSGTDQFVVDGDVSKMFIVGQLLVVGSAANGVGEGRYRTAATSYGGGQTTITVDPLFRTIPPSMLGLPAPVISPLVPIAIISVNEVIPASTTASGTITPQAPTTLPHVLPPTITSTTPSNYLVTWNVEGNIANQLIAGTIVQVKDARVNSSRFTMSFATDTVTDILPNGSYPQGLTQIVMSFSSESAFTPIFTVDGSTKLVFPVPASPFGFAGYWTDDIKSPLALVGQGSPSFSGSLTWGAALQTNLVHITENFADQTPPVAPLYGQLWQDTATPALRKFEGATHPIIDVVTGVNGSWKLDMRASDAPAVGQTLVVYSNVGLGLTPVEYTVGSKSEIATPGAESGYTTTIVVVGTIDPAAASLQSSNLAAPYGYGYDRSDWKDVVTATIPVQDYIDMDDNPIINLADPTNPQDALNLRTGDARYVNVTGDTMTGALAMSNNLITGVADPVSVQDALNLRTGDSRYVNVTGDTMTGALTLTAANLNVNGGNVAITTGSATLTSGSLTLGSGNVNVTSGRVDVGPATRRISIVNNGTAAPTLSFTTTGATTTTGNAVINLGNNKIVNLTNPTNALDAANKTYVDSLANGIIWLQPISDPNLFHDTLTTPPASPLVYTRTYIVPTGATGAWASLVGKLVTWNGTAWVDILGRNVAIGDRFGVLINPDNDELGSLPPPQGGLTGHAAQIATVTGVSPYTYSFYTPTEPDAVSVTGRPQSSANEVNYSPHFGHSYTFRGTWAATGYGTAFQWIEFAGPQMLVDGAGLKYTGNVLNVGQGTGIIVSADAVSLDTTYGNAQYVQLNGATPMTGLLTLSGAPTAALHAATKQYVDQVELDDLADVTITSVASGDHLAWNGTAWVNSAGLTGFSTSYDNTAPNDVTGASTLAAVGELGNIDIVLNPKGSGAVLADLPDGTPAGGNKRGAFVVDLQTLRSSATQVASGHFSVVSGGQNNTAGGTASVVSGGNNNTASESFSVVSGGQNNTASVSFSAVSGGYTNTASGDYSVVSGGNNNTASESYSAVSGGQNNASTGMRSVVSGGQNNASAGVFSVVSGGQVNIASANFSVVSGGNNNVANGDGSFIAGGLGATTRGARGASAHAAGTFSGGVTGQAQVRSFVHRAITTGNTPTSITADEVITHSDSNIVILENNSTYAFEAMVTARETATGDAAWFKIVGAVKRGATAATTAMVGSHIVTQQGADAGASTWNVDVTIDTTLGGFAITGEGQTSKTIKWVANVITTEVVG